MSVPIRQPHPPPLSSYPSSSSSSSSTTSSTAPTQPQAQGFISPPTADQPADLRRNKTLSHPSNGSRWARSGSMSNSAKPVLPEEEGEVAVNQPDTWPETKGLVRQSSLPNRRGRAIAPSSLLQSPPITAADQETAPPRPARRVQRPAYPSNQTGYENGPVTSGQGVTRAQSLRAQAGGVRAISGMSSGGLGRSSSLRSGEPHPPRPSPPPSPSTHASTSPRQPSPPPMSSTAILPPSSVPYLSAKYTPPLQPESQSPSTAGVKRHQSLTQGYGANSRVRDRLERSPAVLSLEQRRLRDTHRTEDEPPTSPVGPSVWSSDQGERADDGWKQALPQRNLLAMIGSQQQSQLQDSFEAMHLRAHSAQPSANGLPPSGRETPVKKLSLVTDSEALSQTQQSMYQQQNALSAAPADPPVGHSTDASSSVLEPSWLASLIGGAGGYMTGNDRDDLSLAQRAALTSIGDNGMGWAERDALLTAAGFVRPGQPNIPWTGPPNVPFHYQQQLPPGMMMRQPQQPNAYAFAQQRGPKPMHHFGAPPGPYHQQSPSEVPADQQNEVIQLAKAKGLNPATFDCRPTYARFFVIKSYTEEDVHKSLKHEIWSSTALGNQRLDKAFQESASKGPIYLFFSVNASGHFCGVAQMLTPVDYNQTSNVWAQDKWKGVFKVKWIFVRDVPNSALRHIKLLNTQERKPITNSRDTQELLYEAGSELLSIFLDFQDRAKTSLLQDFTYYEELEASKASQTPPPPEAATHFNAGPPPVSSIPPQYAGQQSQPAYLQTRGYQQKPGSPAPDSLPMLGARRTNGMGAQAF